MKQSFAQAGVLYIDDTVCKLDDFKSIAKIPADVTIKLSGQSEQEKETQAFLGTAFMIAIGLIFLILVLQFNSMSKPFIVITEIFFSVIGVLLGYAFTGMTIATIMLLVGIVGLAGIVIKNGILLIEFTDELRSRGIKTREAAIQAGKIRIAESRKLRELREVLSPEVACIGGAHPDIGLAGCQQDLMQPSLRVPCQECKRRI